MYVTISYTHCSATCAHPLDTDMFDEMSKYTKEKERLRAKGYATIQTTLGNLNVELHGDRVRTQEATRLTNFT